MAAAHADAAASLPSGLQEIESSDLKGRDEVRRERR
jgi:hypothetical protein